MNQIEASRPNVYSQSPLDRAADRREDVAWIAARLADLSSLFVPVWRGRTLVVGTEARRPEAVYLPAPETDALRAETAGWVFLGLLEARAVFALDVSAVDDPAPLLAGSPGAFVDLRSVGWGEPAPDAAVLAHARAMLHWQGRHRFCGVCGAPCEPKSAGHVMHCTGCGTDHFPRTDSAVIMLIEREDRVLLGHSQRFPRSKMYSTLAGFLEPGESLEEAVRREVFEETSVRVGRLRYHSSQPWPFPGNIMLGYVGEGLTGEIVIEQTELTDARWFGRTELRDPERHGFVLPSADSIARRLIEDWLAE